MQFAPGDRQPLINSVIGLVRVAVIDLQFGGLQINFEILKEHRRAMKALLTFLLFFPSQLIAGEITSDVPANIDPEMAYIFYLHGRIIETEGLRPTHPRWGLYDYPAILDALAQEGITVISERRAKGTETRDYSSKIIGQIEQLVAGGAEPSHITVVGFSAGGAIAMVTSSILSETDVNFVFLASCWDGVKNMPDLTINGRVLSIFEETDQALSCSSLAERKPGPLVFHEIAIRTGKEHGAFYLPRDEWVQPVLNWALGRKESPISAIGGST